MSRARSYSIVKAKARAIIEKLRIREPSEIDIELIAVHEKLHVYYKPLKNEEGRLLRAGNRGLVVVNQATRTSAKWRFVIAHELGHFCCHPDLDQFKLCTDYQLRDWYRTSGHEPEANQFAAELLMPEMLFRPLCDRSRPSLNDIKDLAEIFGTTLSSTAIRFVEMTEEPCAVVHSSSGKIDWVRATSDFGVKLRKGMLVTNATYAGDLFAGRVVEDRPQLIDGAGWSDGAEIDVYEHSMMLGRYGSVLSFLWHPYH